VAEPEEVLADAACDAADDQRSRSGAQVPGGAVPGRVGAAPRDDDAAGGGGDPSGDAPAADPLGLGGWRPTWDEIATAIQAKLTQEGEWAGVPIPIPGLSLVVEPKNRWALDPRLDWTDRAYVCTNAEVDESETVRNHWRSWGRRSEVMLYARQGRAKVLEIPEAPGESVNKLLGTVIASKAWPVMAEVRAMEKLQELLGDEDRRWDQYLMTGSFLETSKRSGVRYLFRKLRPTLAFARSTSETEPVRFLAALCLHAIGYYQGTWAGVMPPTDEVIAHLLLMRGDEHRFWRYANQHPLRDVALWL
jgi:hypothetical protein